ncbi:MAG TPA: hypothetical protein VII43_02195, partial [Opitutaceae bacterium]
MHDKSARELARLGILALAAAWLLHPFFTARLYGAGDALWYANMLADYVTQLRAGVFPVFAGQTQFAFNGAVYPLRVAPMYQHLAGVLDLLTGRTLGFLALQHLTVIVCGFAGIYACYLTLCRIAPHRRWSAAGFAILYLSCPGLLAAIYTQDLYMTWMTVALLPLATFGIWRSFQRDDLASQLWLAAPLAALWWAHAPVALWFTLVVAGSQGLRLLFIHRGWPALRRSLLGAAAFAVLAQYPFVSVGELQTPGSASTVVAALPHAELVAAHIRDAFPSSVLPLSDHARALGDIQLGYALWAVFLGCMVLAFAVRSPELRVLVASAAVLLLLLLPVPGLNGRLWALIPSEIVRITYYWPMQRFCPILAALLAAAGQAALGRPWASRGGARAASAWVLACACAWSLWESRQFIRAASERTASSEASARSQRPENLLLTNSSYGLFSGLPPYFSNGVMAPWGETRLVSPVSGRVLPFPEGRVVDSGPLLGTVDANPGILDLGSSLGLQPGRHYALEISFARDDLPGILQLSGRTLFREYQLPSSGEALAFGCAAGNSRRVDLWTTDSAGDSVALRFIPTGAGAKPEDFERFGSFRLTEADSGQEPV